MLEEKSLNLNSAKSDNLQWIPWSRAYYLLQLLIALVAKDVDVRQKGWDFFSSSSGIDVTIKKSIVKQYRTIEQLGKAFLGCACWPGGWGALWDEKSHGYLEVLPPKKQANEVRQVNAVREWVRNASSPGASERWCMWVATPQLCPVLCKCWLRCMTLTKDITAHKTLVERFSQMPIHKQSAKMHG